MAPRVRSLAPRLATLDTRSAKLAPKRADPIYHGKGWASRHA